VNRFVLAVACCLLAAPLAGQQPEFSQAEVERSRVEKKAWVALNMELAPGEAEQFWPIFEAYQKELVAINTRLARLVGIYARHYR